MQLLAFIFPLCDASSLSPVERNMLQIVAADNGSDLVLNEDEQNALWGRERFTYVR